MSNRTIYIGDEADRFGHADRELSASSRSAAPAGTVIQFQARTAAASMALEDASDPVEGFESIGSLAVRIVAAWKLPRVFCRSMPWEEAAPTGRRQEPEEGDGF